MTDAYENLKNNESVQSSSDLINFLQQISEIKDANSKDDDVIEGVFKKNSRGENVDKKLNQGLSDSLAKLDIETIQIFLDEITEIYHNTNLQLDDQIKNNLENLSNILNHILDKKLTKEQKENIKILQKLGFNLTVGEVVKLTLEQIENIRVIKELGIDVNLSNVENIKDIKLTLEQIENIRVIKEFGIDVNLSNVEKIKDIKLTLEQIENIRVIKELGIDVDLSNVEEIKNIKLTLEQIENIKILVDKLGIHIFPMDIEEIKDIKLTLEQIENINLLKNELGIHIYPSSIEEIKDIKLTLEQIENINLLKNELGIHIFSLDIEEIKDIKLTSGQIENIRVIKELGLDLDSSDIEEIKDITLTSKQIENIRVIKELGISISLDSIVKIKDIKLTSEQIKNIKILVDKLGIYIYPSSIEEIKDIKLTSEQIENIRVIKELGFYVYRSNVEEIKDIKLTSEQIDNTNFLKNRLGIPIYSSDIEKIKDIKLTSEQIDNIKVIKKLGFDVDSSDIERIKDIKLTLEQIENINLLKNELGIHIFPLNIENIKDIKLTSEQIENIKILVNKLGIYISSSDIEKIKNIKLTSEQIENIKILVDKLGIKLHSENIKYIYENLNILLINNENYYEGYGYTPDEIESHHNYKRGRIIENIQSYVQNVISENRDVREIEIIDNIRSDLITLTVDERLKILGGVDVVVGKFNTVRKYLNFKDGPYKSPKELLCAMRGIEDVQIIEGISDSVTMRQHGIGITFFIGDESSYQIIYDTSLIDSGKRSGGFNIQFSAIPDLQGTLSVVNGIDPGESITSYEYGVIWHEGQHNRNTYFMPDKNQGPITQAKDEITAYLRDGRGVDEIIMILIKPENEGGLYQYGLGGEARNNHIKQVKELGKYARDLINLTNKSIGLTRENIISLLSDTPREKWKETYSNIMNAVKLCNEGPIVEKIWWTGTAEKKTEIAEINLANSIDEIKHILNDPKYSHISREPNNKGGIEISAIIDEFINGNEGMITFIPSEIRVKVQELSNKS